MGGEFAVDSLYNIQPHDNEDSVLTLPTKRATDRGCRTVYRRLCLHLMGADGEQSTVVIAVIRATELVGELYSRLPSRC